ncbi:MAG: 4-(cytidine 5'-diphospho)-2-C-methyl-D-erythritol kinase [Oscillospiraceae bacterium]|nr:4-(cytidine 5'-diphospho)-2-C-methyl-D-erythritol kinase [Oscillospiraceae bacterium]
MNEIVLLACGKINLSLDIVGLREDGYHLMDMVMQSVSLADRVTLRRAKEISVITGGGIPADERNTAFKAAKVFFAETGVPGGCEITVEKNIPSEAGMGGGSADAAAVLIGLDQMYGTDLPVDKLMDMGLRVGADVPFCLIGGTALVQGIGERVASVSPMPDCHILLVKPSFGISTGAAFRHFDETGVSVHPDNAALLAAMEAGDLSSMDRFMANVLEESAASPEIEALRETIAAQGAEAALMTGSGSVVFGLFSDEEKARAAAEKVSGLGKVFLARPVPAGTEILSVS